MASALVRTNDTAVSSDVRALEQIRRMRGGSQAHLMRCSDGKYYVVKFQNNPQHRRILANEFLATKLAEKLGLPVPPIAVVEVSQNLIRYTDDLRMELPRTRLPCAAGLQFGSQYPGNPRRIALWDFLPDGDLALTSNLHDFIGMLVFDKWTCNTDARQVLFVPNSPPTKSSVATETAPAKNSSALMIDQGFCFNAGEWSFPDAPLRGLYPRSRVYEAVSGMHSFEPWLAKLESQITRRVILGIAERIPPEWYEGDHQALLQLCEQLLRRRARIRELICEAARSNRHPFPNWIRREYGSAELLQPCAKAPQEVGQVNHSA